mmetsp:Transcript_19725/g.42842  ORF Transcript_19725/g.42842 Transcript_19725/m.42842 type:complete len:252 (+) Transcript_19725:277-1032(+)|eukprot:CAMPEP_0202900496 /NCGR_PEP_ID=MMETSP1392-20130828/11867_1 /ASSEMBLY_ACC=CAM_ASM_000868 /TAXON_ID=225041 /ORGANISM="Chlamydomonas chlamydogama, Strain SAG 11-48b" /LENGTH=251 /DNA_ID=CAMNT_0049586893 /DNA_START=276 /DNA_END=1031 /DNA_ORIENTATION=-
MAKRGGNNEAMVEHHREPCPDRIVDDIGGAFSMGALGGGAWHLLKGLKNSPSGYRFKGALEAMRRESPRLGGSFANWGLTFSCFDCSLQYLRKKEDPWNAIGAGALTGGFLQLRFGLKSAAKSAVFGGFLLALIEGLGIALTKISSPPPPGVPYQPPPGAPGPGEPMPPGPAPPGPEPFPGGMPMGAPDLAAAGPSGTTSSSSSGSWWDFFGSSEPPKPTPAAHNLNEDPFAAPPMPREFQADSFKSDSFK